MLIQSVKAAATLAQLEALKSKEVKK